MLFIDLLIWWDMSSIHDPHMAGMWLRMSLSPSLASSKWQELQRSATEGLRAKHWGNVWDMEITCKHLKSMTSRWLHNLLRKKDHDPRFLWQNVMLFCLGSSYLPGGVPIPWLKIESPQPLRMRAEIQKLSAYRKGLSRSKRIFIVWHPCRSTWIPHTPLMILIDITYQQMHMCPNVL